MMSPSSFFSGSFFADPNFRETLQGKFGAAGSVEKDGFRKGPSIERGNCMRRKMRMANKALGRWQGEGDTNAPVT